MSMIFDLRRVSRDEADALRQDPADIDFFLHGTEPQEPPKGFLQSLFGGGSSPKKTRTWQAPDEDMVLSLDKNWHLLHYLLARDPWKGPLPQATLMGGDPLGTVDVGYGPARLVQPEQISDFLAYLHTLDKQAYASDVTSQELEEQEIYGAYPEWTPRDAEDLWEYIEDMKSFFQAATTNNECIILYLY